MSYISAEDATKLIQLVREREHLWDTRHPRYGDEEDSWREIASIVGKLDAAQLKTQWQQLRDSFHRRSDSQPTHYHYEQLSFLNDVPPQAEDSTEMNIKEEFVRVKVEVDHNDMNGESANDSEYDRPPRIRIKSEYADPQTKRSSSRKQRKTSKASQRAAAAAAASSQRRKLESVGRKNSISKNTDEQFLMSLMLYMRDIKPQRKLQVRSKLLQVFIDEQTRTERRTKNPSQSPSTSPENDEDDHEYDAYYI